MIIDCHAHLYYDELLKDIDNVLKRADESGVVKIIIPAVDIKTSEKILLLAEKYNQIYAAVGFHPCNIKGFTISDLKFIESLLSHSKVVAIGEIGLDYYWDKTNLDFQKAFFSEQIEMAKTSGLPIIVHTRDSSKDAIEMISVSMNENLAGQFHCFSGDENDLDKILSLNNFYVSFCGNITFKKFSGRNLIELTPVERMLAETDSPFLSPEPFRGKTNEPSRVVHTLKKIAEIKNCDYEILENSIYNNTIELFKKLN
jgi:TatD DNase family protein